MQFRFFERFGKYVFLERLGRGGMAEVYLAIAPGAIGVNKLYAVKKIVSENLNQNSYVDMFKEEAQIAIQLQHNNIVSVHDFGFENAQFFLVMEYVQGKNLAAFLKQVKKKRKILPLPLVAYIMHEITAGLEYAHGATALGTGLPLHIIHRDINPHNIMVSYSGDIKIIDFGVAKVANPAEEELRKRSSGLVGKIHYMPPEMVGGRELDPRSDQFSLGVLFWELITGNKLFDGETEKDILENIKKSRIPSIKRQNPFVTDELERIVLRCLKADPNERYQKTTDLLKDVNFYLTNNFPDFTQRNLQEFFKGIVGDEEEEAQQRIRSYYNMHFGDAMGNAALAVPKSALPPKFRPLPNVSERGETETNNSDKPIIVHHQHQPQPESDAAPSSQSRSQTQSQYQSHSQSHSQNRSRSLGRESAHTRGSEIPSLTRKQSKQDKVAFSKALYTSTKYTQESLIHQNTKMRIIYGVIACLFFFGLVYFTQSKNLFSRALTTGKSVQPFSGDVFEVGSIKYLSARDQQGCLINAVGQLSCWGRNDLGQLGLGDVSNFENIRDVTGAFKFENVSLGPAHSCGVTQVQLGGQLRKPLKCWGDNSEGQLGDSTVKMSLVPVTVDFGVDYLETSVGLHHSCGLTKEKTVKCWGQGTFGQLGKASHQKAAKPIPVGLPEPISGIASGAEHVCALSETGRIYCWGRNDLGQTGTSKAIQVSGEVIGDIVVPTAIRSSSVFVALALGEHHGCGLTLPGDIECWGKNEYGQLGLGTAEPTPVPMKVQAEKGENLIFSQIVTGRSHTCAVDMNRNLWCWGRNDRGQIVAKSSIKTFRFPTRIVGASAVSKVALGDVFTCWTQGVNMSCLGDPKIGDPQRPSAEGRVPARVGP
ncbi:MAG: protein kinase [Bdellovibrionaceae bacterium]|nr:protein kinase [Pseudobdellovibrionaceae bacterium]